MIQSLKSGILVLIFILPPVGICIGPMVMSYEAAEKLAFEPRVRSQRLKPNSKQSSYRSAEALRHLKSNAT
jgi:hypothetical protein